MRITIAQLNPTVGDISGNLEKVKEACVRFASGSDLIVFPELFLVGYPPCDLLKTRWFIKKAGEAVEEISRLSRQIPNTGILLGVPTPSGKDTGKGLTNSAVLIYGGAVIGKQAKSLLPTYDVFDEARYFDPATEVTPLPFQGEMLGVSICEDAWNTPELWPKKYYSFDPISALVKKGATILINISASPFSAGKENIRYQIIRNHSRKHGLPFLFINQVGGTDELIFDGRSMFLDRTGKPVSIFPSFKENLETNDTAETGADDRYAPQEETASVHDALILGIRDYMHKCGFHRVVIGISGGIDSAVTCALAQKAAGAQNVLGVALPSLYTSPESIELAKQLTRNLKVELKNIPITNIYNAYIRSLSEYLPPEDPEVDPALENIQARIRGNILMAFSNRLGHLLLSTGNKSEMATGYCTLYGDMSGGLAVLSDVPKTMVYKLAEYLNRESKTIPAGILRRPPSAELKPDQVDQDILPPYPVLDKILAHYIEKGRSAEEIVELNFDPKTVEWIIGAVNRNEYKRRQAPPGLKVTSKAFGAGRRMPIAAKY